MPFALSAATGKQKILVIDDDSLNAHLISSIVSSLCEVHTALFAHEGLALAKTQVPDLILLDVLMPDMDGFETYQLLQLDPVTADIPVIFLTATSDSDIEEKCLNVGAADFVSKPFRSATLLARVRNHLKLEQQRKLLTHLAHNDSLTGTANRRYFNTVLAQELQRMQSQHADLALLMIDVDEFKTFNDYYGHIYGDECLQRVAQAIVKSMPSDNEIVARYGGEEFVCLLPHFSMPKALQIAHQIQANIAALRIPHVHAQAAGWVTVSIGAAALRSKEITSANELVSMADARLLHAKRTGRNRIVHSD